MKLLDFLYKLAEDSALTRNLVAVQPSRRPTDPKRRTKFPVGAKVLRKEGYDMAWRNAGRLAKRAYSDNPGDEAYTGNPAPNAPVQMPRPQPPAAVQEVPAPLAPTPAPPSIAPNAPAPAPTNPMIGAAINPYAMTPGRKRKRDDNG